MGKYSSDPAWADITPLPTDDGGPRPLAAIAYSPAYAETMSYLRAVMAASELSARALALTADLIAQNPAHYTVWLYRARILFALAVDLRQEISWTDAVAVANQKNYQIWHHRTLIVDKLGDCAGEREFVARMLGLDAKNYHVWAYRQWLVRRFGLWDDGEVEFTEGMLREDVRNNSAWNHRWYVVNGRGTPLGQREGGEGEGERGGEGEGGERVVAGVKGDEGIRKREIAFAAAALERSPHNPSPWNYLRGIVRESGMPVGELKGIAERYADLSRPGGVRSSHALDLLAEIWAAEEGQQQRAAEALELLASTYDPIRKNYWEYRKGQLGSLGETTSAAA